MKVSVKYKWPKPQKSRPLLIGKTLIHPGGYGDVDEAELKKFCKGPAGEWYRDNALEFEGNDTVDEVEEEAETDEATEVDWAKAEAFTDKKDLKEYAAKFGVNLNGQKSLENMLEDFMEGMGCK